MRDTPTSATTPPCAAVDDGWICTLPGGHPTLIHAATTGDECAHWWEDPDAKASKGQTMPAGIVVVFGYTVETDPPVNGRSWGPKPCVVCGAPGEERVFGLDCWPPRAACRDHITAACPDPISQTLFDRKARTP